VNSRARRLPPLAALILAAAGSLATAGDGSRPNILFITADEFRHDALGVAGHPIVKTPHLDSLARGGARFVNSYATAPLCSPSRATLFTSRYPHETGVLRNNGRVNEKLTLLPHLLREHGYHVALAGKMHLRDRGWWDASWETSQGKGRAYRKFLREKLPDFTGNIDDTAVPGTLVRYPELERGIRHGPIHIGTSPIPEELFEEAWVADRAIDYITDRARNHPGKPWFLFLSLYKPHSEYVIPEPYATMYAADEIPLPETFDAGAQKPPPSEFFDDRMFIDDPAILGNIVAHYYGAVTMVDRQIGRVLAALDELSLEGETIVVFTSDHGNMLGEHNLMFKKVMYDPAVKVPLILRAPGVKAGGVFEAPVDGSVVMPTLLELAGLPRPDSVRASSIVPLLRGEKMRTTALSELQRRMVRRGDWKLVVPWLDTSGGEELYNVTKDPLERENLYGKPEGAAALDELRAALDELTAPGS